MHRLIRRHGDLELGNGVTAAADMPTMGLHTGTHLDAVGHVAKEGRLHDGLDAASEQTAAGLKRRGVDELGPFLCRGILLDVARHRRVEMLAAAEAVSAAEIDACLDDTGVNLRRGDAVLVRTGWPAVRRDRARFAGRDGAPGVGADAARLLADRGGALVGADTPAFEPLPSSGIPTHVELLVERGIPILEFLDLEALGTARPRKFILVVVPLRIAGGTASPVRPVALV